MAKTTLTHDEADALFKQGLAILEGTTFLTTRDAEYDWNPDKGIYECMLDGLRIKHRLGVRWNGTRFVRCTCDYCRQYPIHAAEVEIHE